MYMYVLYLLVILYMKAESQRASLEKEMRERVQKAQNDVSGYKNYYVYAYIHTCTYVNTFIY